MIIIIIVLYSPYAYAYIGPGMGVGVIIAALGVFGAILLGIFGILYYPIKRLIKKIKNKNTKKQDANRKL